MTTVAGGAERGAGSEQSFSTRVSFSGVALEQGSNVRRCTHVQTFGDSFQRHRGFSSQPCGNPSLLRDALATALQVPLELKAIRIAFRLSPMRSRPESLLFFKRPKVALRHRVIKQASDRG
jgi:hypothetical protein